MSVFDEELSSRKIERKTRADIAYMYLATMEKPPYRTSTIKVEYTDLIDEAFKTTIKITKDNNLIKIHHLSLEETKIKAKTSINKLTDEKQIKIMKNPLQKSIEMDQEENEELSD